MENYCVSIVLAADPVVLNIPPATLRVKPRYGGLIHPKVICHRFGWCYEVVDHSSPKCAELIRQTKADIGIIAGARILKEPVISSSRLGTVNLHPGLIPEGRGLDALQWAIYENRPVGVTAHLIDGRVDAGCILIREEIRVYEDDTLVDLSLRLHEKQLELLPRAIELLGNRGRETLPLVGKAPLHKKMPAELEQEIPQRFAGWLKKMAQCP